MKRWAVTRVTPRDPGLRHRDRGEGGGGAGGIFVPVLVLPTWKFQRCTYVQNSSGDNDTAFSKLKIWSYFFLWIQTIIFLSKRKYWLESIKFYFSSEETINLYSVRKNEMGFLFLGNDEALAFKAFDELINWRGGKSLMKILTVRTFLTNCW